MSLSTHVLDAALGRPAPGVPVALLRDVDGVWEPVAAGETDRDGRLSGLGEPLEIGVWRLQFDTAAYFAATDRQGFYPEVVVTFEVTDASAHHHVPLLLSPFAYSTYRGS